MHKWVSKDESGDENVITEMRLDDVRVTAIATPEEAMSDPHLTHEVIKLPGGKSAIVAVNQSYIDYLIGSSDDDEDDEDVELFSEDVSENPTIDPMEIRMRNVYTFGVTIGQILTVTCVELKDGQLF